MGSVAVEVMCVESGDRAYPTEATAEAMIFAARQLRDDARSVGIRARTFRFFVDGKLVREVTGALSG